ncbi:hypothetical protein D9V37_07380 [Nocardioides mangrovicus]|uniref:JAB domain-containing protein n=1 Tax=Nocardioides mangrovicus TaxID=2478913 RepID=A0A3L8P2T1_9ACTN|nr:hypothetical protein D9V37_07380 [Nocardioides mangrovicus]
MIGRRQRVSLHPYVPRALTAAARRSEPKETGGLLLGWTDGGIIVVRHALEVPDPSATQTSWTRSETRANEALTKWLSEAAHPWLGYVGDWHAHPAPVGASTTDKRCLKKDSRVTQKSLVLIVHRSDETLDVLTAQRGSAARTTLITYEEINQKDQTS